MTVYQALVRNVRTCRRDAKGERQVSGPHKVESTDARHRDGAACISEDDSESEFERRGCVIWHIDDVNRQRDECRG
jgi:hypothetical protein